MTDAFAALADADVRGSDAFTVDPDHATVAFGEQADPPGRPAADDVTPDEGVPVLGTPYLLARFEFTARESLRGHLPDSTGVVGRSASLSHLAPVAVGSRVELETTLVGVDRPALSFACRSKRDDGATVATGDLTFRVVDRDDFRRSVARQRD